MLYLTLLKRPNLSLSRRKTQIQTCSLDIVLLNNA